MTAVAEAEGYPPGTVVHFDHDGQPFLGRVIADDPVGQRAKVRIITGSRTKPRPAAMTTSWVAYKRIKGIQK